MAKKTVIYQKLDPEMMKEITGYVIDTLREEEAASAQASHGKKRANIKLLLRNYRDIVDHVEDAVYDAIQLDYDLKLQDILELMSGKRGESFRVESIRENAATARIIVGHIDRMMDSYRDSCEKYGKEEDRRRFRVVQAAYIAPEHLSIDDIARAENIDRSTVYRDIDAAADRLAVLFFGVYGLRFL